VGFREGVALSQAGRHSDKTARRNSPEDGQRRLNGGDYSR
jgi:hypothetical protein